MQESYLLNLVLTAGVIWGIVSILKDIQEITKRRERLKSSIDELKSRLESEKIGPLSDEPYSSSKGGLTMNENLFRVREGEFGFEVYSGVIRQFKQFNLKKGFVHQSLCSEEGIEFDSLSPALKEDLMETYKTGGFRGIEVSEFVFKGKSLKKGQKLVIANIQQISGASDAISPRNGTRYCYVC